MKDELREAFINGKKQAGLIGFIKSHTQQLCGIVDLNELDYLTSLHGKVMRIYKKILYLDEKYSLGLDWEAERVFNEFIGLHKRLCYRFQDELTRRFEA